MSEPIGPDNGEPELFVRCDSGIRRLLRMAEEEIVAEVEGDRERLAAVTEDEEGVLPQAWPHPVFGRVELSAAGEASRVSAIVDFAGNRDDLESLGIGVRSGVQDVFVVRATVEQLRDLAGRAATARIVMPRPLVFDSKDALRAAEIDQAQALGSRGKGTLVGIVDTVLDVEHRAVREAAAPHGTRVRYLWVQAPELPGSGSLPGESPEEYSKSHAGAPDFSGLDYGRIYDGAAIDAALASGATYGVGAGQIAKKPGPVEHGTHVAGIAAGTKLPNGHVGAAPDAYGHGRLRILGALAQSYQQTDVDVWVRTDKSDKGEKVFLGPVFWHAPEVRLQDGAGKATDTLRWDQGHRVRVRVYNLGKTPAIRTRVALKYTRPWAAPRDWAACTDAGGAAIVEEVNVGPLGHVDVTFASPWVPRQSQVPGGAGWGDHYCLLVELDHPQDKLHYDDQTASGRDPWVKNITGANNVALRNLHIQ